MGWRKTGHKKNTKPMKPRGGLETDPRSGPNLHYLSKKLPAKSPSMQILRQPELPPNLPDVFRSHKGRRLTLRQGL